MYKIISREDPKRHPILKTVINFIDKGNYTFSRPSIVIKKMKQKIIIFDPISALLVFSKVDYFFCLEMYEYQVANNTLRNKIRNKIYRKCLYYAFKKSKIVIFPNELRLNYYLEKYRLNKNNLLIFENLPSKSTRNLISNIPNRHRKFFAIYAGTINSENRGLNTFFELARRNSDKDFGICGRISNISLLKKLPLNVKYLGDLDEIGYLNILKQSLNGFLFYSNDNLNTKYCASVKMYEYLASGCNIIANRNESILHDKKLVMYWVTIDGDVLLNEHYDVEAVAQKNNRHYELYLETTIT